MTPHHQHEQVDLETGDDLRLISRRTLLRRSVLGIGGGAAVSLLVACGGDEEDLEDVEGVDVQPPDAPDIDPDEPALPGTDDDEDPDDAGEESD